MSRQRQGASRGLLASWLSSPPPDAAIEIFPEQVSAATMAVRGGGLRVQAYAAEPLPPGALVPSLTAPNVIDRDAVVGALRSMLDRLGTRPRRAALIIPDVVAKVSLVRFEKVPSRREDLDQLVRWQLRKSTPFAIDEACVTYSRGAQALEGTEFLAAVARRNIIEEYEGLCEAIGAAAGLVDLATLSILNLFVADGSAPAGDWLVVHMRPEYTTLAIMRGDDVIFFRNRPEDDQQSLHDLVHQTAMYYEDRLSGHGFGRVLLGGAGRVPGAVDAARRDLEQRLGVAVESIDSTRVATLADRIAITPEQMDTLAPLVGMLLRTRLETVTA